jgi:hypothetical protein
MLTRLLLAVSIVLTLVCGGIAIYYNRVFESLQVALADTKAQLAAAQASTSSNRSRLQHRRAFLALVRTDLSRRLFQPRGADLEPEHPICCAQS